MLGPRSGKGPLPGIGLHTGARLRQEAERGRRGRLGSEEHVSCRHQRLSFIRAPAPARRDPTPERRLQKRSESLSSKHSLDRVLTPLEAGEESPVGCWHQELGTHSTPGPVLQASPGLSQSSQQPFRYLVLFRHEETEGQRGYDTGLRSHC